MKGFDEIEQTVSMLKIISDQQAILHDLVPESKDHMKCYRYISVMVQHTINLLKEVEDQPFVIQYINNKLIDTHEGQLLQYLINQEGL